MKTLRITSPGVLLIAAVVAAGGILLLDVFFLRPYVENQKWIALRDRAAKAEHVVQMAFYNREASLRNAGSVWIKGGQVRRFLSDKPPAEPFEHLAAQALAETGAELAWLTGPNQQVLGLWTKGRPAKQSEMQSVSLGDEVRPQVQGGVILLPDGVGIFARQRIPDEANPDRTLGELWLARSLGKGVMNWLGSAIDGHIALLPPIDLPDDKTDADAASCSLWLSPTEGLIVTRPVRDTSGNVLGSLRIVLSVTNICNQVATARRMVLIVLTLSSGLTLLIIMGIHILIVGPVFRLLRRLQQVQAGDSATQELSRNLHGEPLILAQQLETAFDKLATLSKTDQLTHLANRRHFDEVLTAFYHQARRYNRPLSLMEIDVDFFKVVNDTGGHQLGDEVLKDVAGALERICRKADLPARVGGDEFCVLLPETIASDAAAVAERVRKEVAHQVVATDVLKLNVTLSIGVTDLNSGEINSPGAMMAMADEALYAAKRLGRNRVVQAHDLDGLDRFGECRESDKVNLLSKKLGGLDNQFKNIFIRVVEELVEVLAERDPHKVDHPRKVAHYACLIAHEMELSQRVIKRIEMAAMLHDIGMIALPDSVLLCPTALNEEQLRIMRRHPLLSVRIMEGMEFLEQEIPAVRYHHERYDGGGYPEGIAGAAIPLTARIISVADAFDAMTSSRTFRDAKTQAEALKELKQASCTQFDPVVVDAMLVVAARLGDEIMNVLGSEKSGDRHRAMPAGAVAGV